MTDVIYGDTLFVHDGFSEELVAGDLRKMKYKKPFVHQSALVRTDVQKKYPFDLRYRISADYDFFLKLYLRGKNFLHIDCLISAFSDSGMSCDPVNEKEIFAESIALQRRNGLNIWNTPILIPYRLKRYIKMAAGHRIRAAGMGRTE